MALAFTEEKFVTNNIRTKQIKEGYLITNDYGAWVYLTKEEYKQFKNKELEEPLTSLLKDKGIILNEDNINNVIEDYRKKCNYLFQGASLHIIVPTLRCNQKCVYCHSQAKPVDDKNCDMDEKTAKKTVDFIFQTPSKTITIEFQGGEALLNFEIVKFIIEYAKKRNQTYNKELNFKLVTNLTLMNDEILDYLIKERIGLCTSLDGCKEVHDKNRGDYDKIVEWIKKIKQKHEINALMLTTKHSLPYHKEIIDEYVKLGMNTIFIKPINYIGNAKHNWNEISFDEKEYLDFWKKSLDYIIKNHPNLREYFTLIILRKILKKECYNFTDLQSPCGAAISQLLYNYDGNIYSCDEAKIFDIFKLGTVDDSYKKVLTKPETLSITLSSINDSLLCDNCTYKPYCGVCPVCNYAKYGTTVSKVFDRRCKILKGMFDHIFEKFLFDKEYKNIFLNWIGKKSII